MNRPDARDHADLGTGLGAQLCDLTEAAHAHLADDDLRVRLDARKRQWEADLVVVPALRRNGTRMGAAERRQDVLRRRLARRSGDGHDLRRAASARCAAQGGQGGEGVLRDQYGGGPARERVGQEVDAVADGHEEVTLVDTSGVHLDSGRLVGPGSTVEPARAEGLDLVQRERDQAAAPRRLRASRATSRSSKGTVRSRNC